MKLSKENYYKTVDEYAVRFMEGSDRSHVFEELVKKGIDKKEASMICDLAQRTAKRNKNIEDSKHSRLIGGMLLIIIGTFGYFGCDAWLKAMFEHGSVGMGFIIFLSVLTYSGLFISLIGIGVTGHYFIEKRKERKINSSDILDI